MGRVAGGSCYLCGEYADGPDDHVPPEVLFRGASGRLDKSPGIIRVPSCVTHNDGASGDDEVLAWILSDAGVFTNAGMDAHQSLMQHVAKRAWNDPEFADRRLAHIGVRLFRSPKDYDNEGKPKRPTYDAAYVARVERDLRQLWAIAKRGFQKIAAGLYFHATDRRSLGVERAGRLTVVPPDFKQIEPTLTLTGLTVDEDSYFAPFSSKWNEPLWKSILSGSPEAFGC